MAEERNLGLARATQRTEEEESKEELQRRMELARDSISHTVTEIKETVAHQVQAVKDTLDWREQFKKRPLAWSAGAMGVGFVAGYSIAGSFKGDDENVGASTSYSFAPQASFAPEARRAEASMSPGMSSSLPADGRVEGTGLMGRLKESSAYESLSKEVSSLGNKLVEELSSTAHLVVLPFVLTKLKEWVGLDRLEESTAASGSSARSGTRRTDWTESERIGSTRESTRGHA